MKKVHEKKYQERGQELDRLDKFKYLEKRVDYKKRSKHKKMIKQNLNFLSEQIKNKNPDEFYFHMINSKMQNGMHVELQKENTEIEDVRVQRLLQTQDYNYVLYKRLKEDREIEKIKQKLHFIKFDDQIINQEQSMSYINKNQNNKTQYSNSSEAIIAGVKPKKIKFVEDGEQMEKYYQEVKRDIENNKQPLSKDFSDNDMHYKKLIEKLNRRMERRNVLFKSELEFMKLNKNALNKRAV